MGKVLAATLVCLLAIAAIGQEPLPRVQPKADPAIDLAPEPGHDVTIVTLAQAAARNDYGTFEYLYDRQPDSAYADLHELWKYAQTDRLGAFYGSEMHDRLARRYPGFAAYIDEYRIVDSRGQVFYPTSETRAFLLRQAMSGSRPHAAPIRVAQAQRTPARPKAEQHKAASPTRTVASVKVRRPAVKAEEHKASSPARKAATVRVHPALKTEAPKVAAPQPIAAAKPPAAVAPKAQPAPQASQPAPQVVSQPTGNSVTARGILLMILGLLGIGVLTMMMRTPLAETTHEAEPEAPAPPSSIPTLKLTKLPPPDEEHRRTGSHG